MFNFASMNIEEVRQHCLSFSQVSEEMPFDDETLVFKVEGKIFCMLSLEGNLRMTVKCDPEEALELRETFSAVLPGYHMNKKHWNTVLIDGTISDNMLKIWIEKSYRLITGKLTRVQKSRLGL